MPSISLNVLVGVSILLSLRIGAPQFIQHGLCDMQCLCSSTEAVVHCNRQDRLQGVPTNLPHGVTKLYIQEGDFHTPSVLTRTNMTGLEELEDLRIIYCNLEAIESKTFLGMTKLKHLDLSHNALQKLDTYTFFGLQLINLYLQEQHNLSGGLLINEGTFDGLTADQINLRGNKLSAIRYSVFSKVGNLHRLILSDNRITHLDDEFSKHFNKQTFLLDLTSNPLECSCNLAWIAELSDEWADSLPGLNMTCLYRQNMETDTVVIELRRLSIDHLCPGARIHHIEVNIIDVAGRAIMDCTAVAVPRTLYSNLLEADEPTVPTLLTRTPPEVAWQYIENGHLREIRRLPSESHANSNQLLFNRSAKVPSSTVRLNVSLGDGARQYKCTTRNAVQDPQEVVITVRVPPQREEEHNKNRELKNTELNFYPKLTSSTAPHVKESSMHQELLFREQHYLLQPQFSIIQMALAVGGTFLATLIILFIGARCLNTFRSHTMFRLASSASFISATDAKAVYHPGITSITDKENAEKNVNSQKQNGTDFSSTYNIPNQMLLYPQLLFSGTDNRASLSPQFTHLTNLQNHYIQSTVLPAAHSSQCNIEKFPSSLSHLVSSTIVHPNITSQSVINSDIPMSPGVPNLRPSQNLLEYRPVCTGNTIGAPPGSPYSFAGSHEYDVPRVLELPSWNRVGTIGRSNVTDLTDAGCDFHLNKGVSPL